MDCSPSPVENRHRQGHLALLDAAESVTGLVLDDDDAHIFIKEESLSPIVTSTPVVSVLSDDRENPKPSLAGLSERKPNGSLPSPTKSSQYHSVTSSRRHGRVGKPVSRSLHRGPPASGNMIIPRRVEDWEPWKDILHDLYITQNRILRDIIVIMETKHNVRATPKMYKNQFARWGFFKYAVKKRPRIQSDSSVSDRSTDDLDSMQIVRPSNGLIHAGDSARGIQSGLSAIRRFLQAYVDQDPANRNAEEVAGFVDPCYRYFKVAMDLFDLRENIEGGQVLRLAFLHIERKLAKPTMKSFSDLCLLIPHLLLESGRRDILGAYLRYLKGLAILKFGKNHPVAELASSFAALADRPEDMLRYITALAQLNADTISALPVLDRTRQWARYQYFACERSTSSPLAITYPDAQSQTQPRLTSASRPDGHHMIRLEAQSVYWAQKLILHDPLADSLAHQWLDLSFAPDYATQCEALLTRLAAAPLPSPFGRMLECLVIGWIHDYYDYIGNWEMMFEWGRRGLELSRDEQYALWSMHLEERMRVWGDVREAERLRERRRADQWLEKVRGDVERLTLG